jgi:hypothetical protein
MEFINKSNFALSSKVITISSTIKPEDCTNSLLLLQPFVFLLHFTLLQNFGNFHFSKFNDFFKGKNLQKQNFFFKSKKSKDSKFPQILSLTHTQVLNQRNFQTDVQSTNISQMLAEEQVLD